MKKLKLAVAITIMVMAWAYLREVQAQTSSTIQIQGSAAHTTCTISPAGGATFCFATDGLWESLNGGAFTQLTAAAPAGVTSLTICNAAGTTCSAPQTGAVTLDVPKTVTVTGALQ